MLLKAPWAARWRSLLFETCVLNYSACYLATHPWIARIESYHVYVLLKGSPSCSTWDAKPTWKWKTLRIYRSRHHHPFFLWRAVCRRVVERRRVDVILIEVHLYPIPSCVPIFGYFIKWFSPLWHRVEWILRIFFYAWIGDSRRPVMMRIAADDDDDKLEIGTSRPSFPHLLPNDLRLEWGLVQGNLMSMW